MILGFSLTMPGGNHLVALIFGSIAIYECGQIFMAKTKWTMNCTYNNTNVPTVSELPLQGKRNRARCSNCATIALSYFTCIHDDTVVKLRKDSLLMTIDHYWSLLAIIDNGLATLPVLVVGGRMRVNCHCLSKRHLWLWYLIWLAMWVVMCSANSLEQLGSTLSCNFGPDRVSDIAMRRYSHHGWLYKCSH